MLDETDLKIVHALQESPRASWAVIGDVLGLDSRSVSRRYEQMVDRGELRVTVIPGPRLLEHTTSALLRVRTTPGQAESVARQFAKSPNVTAVRVADGTFSLHVLLTGRSSREIWQTVEAQTATMPQVADTRLHTIVKMWDVGRAQRLTSLSPTQIAKLRRSRDCFEATEREAAPLTAIDWNLISLLIKDGRREIAALAEEIGRSPSATSRRIARLQSDRVLDFLTLTADPVSSRPVTALLWCSVASGELPMLGEKIAPAAWLGLMAVMTGPSNVFVTAHVTNGSDIFDVIAEIRRHCPSLTVQETQISMFAVKLYARLIDADERWTDDVAFLSDETLRSTIAI